MDGSSDVGVGRSGRVGARSRRFKVYEWRKYQRDGNRSGGFDCYGSFRVPDEKVKSSDGCTSPLGKWLEDTYPDALRCCIGHDADYEFGGSERDRLAADLHFFL